MHHLRNQYSAIIEKMYKEDSMVTDQALAKMIEFYQGNYHDISHTLNVYSLARTIGREEKLDEDSQQILELSAIVHDISCPLCRKKYGNTNGKNQEAESPALVHEFLKDLPVPLEQVERISWIVSHHHTYIPVNGIEHQILLEADFLVNAGENQYAENVLANAKNTFFETSTGKRLLNYMFCLKS